MCAEKMKICPVCGKRFKPWKRKVYCDKKCTRIARLQRNKKKKEVKQIQKAECSIRGGSRSKKTWHELRIFCWNDVD